MKGSFSYIAFAILIWSCLSASSSSISTCITYENNSSYKWCRYYATTTSGYACASSDTSRTCGGNSLYRCSSDSSSYLPQNSKKLLCPIDYSNCYSQEAYLYSSTNSSTLYSNYFGTSTYCWYKFTPYSLYINSLKIKINSMSNANAEVYYESPTDTYIYKGTLTSGNSMNISVSNYDPVWMLVTPSSNSAYVSVTATASESSNTSYSSSSSNDNSYLVAILVPTIVGGTYFIILIISLVVCSSIARKRQLQALLANANAAAVAQPSQVPQLYYPPGHINYVPNPPTAPVIYAPHQLTYPVAQDQQIYALEPALMASTLPPIYVPSQPVQTNTYVQEGVPVMSK